MRVSIYQSSDNKGGDARMTFDNAPGESLIISKEKDNIFFRGQLHEWPREVHVGLSIREVIEALNLYRLIKAEPKEVKK